METVSPMSTAADCCTKTAIVKSPSWLTNGYLISRDFINMPSAGALSLYLSVASFRMKAIFRPGVVSERS
jgi:hypothetical protein